MKGYNFHIWREVRKLGTNEFSHNISREKIIHAANKRSAKEKVKKEMDANEFIYRVECLGVVHKVITTHYEYTPTKRPHYDPD